VRRWAAGCGRETQGGEGRGAPTPPSSLEPWSGSGGGAGPPAARQAPGVLDQAPRARASGTPLEDEPGQAALAAAPPGRSARPMRAAPAPHRERAADGLAQARRPQHDPDPGSAGFPGAAMHEGVRELQRQLPALPCSAALPVASSNDRTTCAGAHSSDGGAAAGSGGVLVVGALTPVTATVAGAAAFAPIACAALMVLNSQRGSNSPKRSSAGGHAGGPASLRSGPLRSQPGEAGSGSGKSTVAGAAPGCGGTCGPKQPASGDTDGPAVCRPGASLRSAFRQASVPPPVQHEPSQREPLPPGPESQGLPSQPREAGAPSQPAAAALAPAHGAPAAASAGANAPSPSPPPPPDASTVKGAGPSQAGPPACGGRGASLLGAAAPQQRQQPQPPPQQPQQPRLAGLPSAGQGPVAGRQPDQALWDAGIVPLLGVADTLGRAGGGRHYRPLDLTMSSAAAAERVMGGAGAAGAGGRPTGPLACAARLVPLAAAPDLLTAAPAPVAAGPAPAAESAAPTVGSQGTDSGSQRVQPGSLGADTVSARGGSHGGSQGTDPGSQRAQPGSRGAVTVSARGGSHGGSQGTDPGSQRVQPGSLGADTVSARGESLGGSQGTDPGSQRTQLGSQGADPASAQGGLCGGSQDAAGGSGAGHGSLGPVPGHAAGAVAGAATGGGGGTCALPELSSSDEQLLCGQQETPLELGALPVQGPRTRAWRGLGAGRVTVRVCGSALCLAPGSRSRAKQHSIALSRCMPPQQASCAVSSGRQAALSTNVAGTHMAGPASIQGHCAVGDPRAKERTAASRADQGMHACCCAGALVPVRTSWATMYLPSCQWPPVPLTATSPWHTPVPDRGHDPGMASLDPLLPLAAPGLPGWLSPGAGGCSGEAGCTAAAWRSGAAPGSAAEAARAVMGRGAHRQDAGTGSLNRRRARGAGAANGATQRMLAGVTPLASRPGTAPEAPPPSRAPPEAGLQTHPRPDAQPRPASAAGPPLHRLACCVASQPNPSAPSARFSLSQEEGGSPAPVLAGAPAWSSQPAPCTAWRPPARAPFTQARSTAAASEALVTRQPQPISTRSLMSSMRARRPHARPSWTASLAWTQALSRHVRVARPPRARE